MQQRLISALVAIVLVLGAIAGCGSNLDVAKKEAPQGVIFVSKHSPLAFSLLAGWQQIQQQPPVAQVLKSLLTKQNLNYKKDIAPWLGEEITLAVTDLDFDHEPANGVQPGYLLVATTKDGAKSQEFLQTWLSQKLLAGTALNFTPYKGTQLIYPQGEEAGDSSSQFASTVVGDRFVLIANHPQVLRQAINNAQAIDLSLASSPSYQQTLASLDQPHWGLGFINLPAVTAWLGKHGELTQEPPFSSLAIALAPQDRGLVATMALTQGVTEAGETTAVTEELGADKSEATALSPAWNYLPTGGGLAIGGQHLPGFLQQSLDPLTAPDSRNLFTAWLENLFNKVDRELHLELHQDIFPWVTGDYVLSWLPKQIDPTQELDKNSSKSSSQGDWLFVAERSDPKVKEAIDHLDRLAVQQGFSITPLKLAEQPVTLWTELQTQPTAQGLQTLDTLVRGVHTSQGNYEIFASSVGAMGAALGIHSRSLPTTQGFREAIDLFSKPNQGYLYLDWQTARPFLESQFPLLRLLEVPLSPLLQNLGTISFTSYGDKEGIISSQLFLNVKKS